jgi:hypothetical protein
MSNLTVPAFLTTDCATAQIRTVKRKSLNRSLLVATAFFALAEKKTKQKYFTFKEITDVLAENAYTLEVRSFSSTVQDLSGNPSKRLRYRRNVLIKKRVTPADRAKYAWPTKVKYKYAFNYSGSLNFAEELRTATYNNVTQASIAA